MNNSEISLNFRLIYFMTYSAEFPRINNFMTWRWPRAGAETCRQFKITTSNKVSCVFTHLKPSLYCIIKHNGDYATKDGQQSYSTLLLWVMEDSMCHWLEYKLLGVADYRLLFLITLDKFVTKRPSCFLLWNGILVPKSWKMVMKLKQLWQYGWKYRTRTVIVRE